MRDYKRVDNGYRRPKRRKHSESYIERINEYFLRRGPIAKPTITLYPNYPVGKIQKRGRLQKKFAAMISLISSSFGALFLSSNITGMAIGNLNNLDVNVMGTVLFALGVIGMFLFLRRG